MLVTFFGCEEQIVETVPPELGETSSISFGDSIVLRTEIVSLGSLPIDKYGFVISTSMPPILGSTLDALLTEPIKSDVYSTTIFNKLGGEGQYFISGFILTKEDTVYGDYVVWDGRDRNPPIVRTIEPGHGYKGELVKIRGGNFDNDKANLTVKFGELEAEIISSSLDQISVKVPAYINSEIVDLVVEREGKRSTGLSFSFDGPKVSSFTPAVGMEEFTVTIQGSGFSEATWRNMVNISTIRNMKVIRYATTVLSATSTELIIKINAYNILPGLYAVAVTADDITSTALNQLEISTPWSRLKDKPLEGIGASANFEIDGRIFVCAGTTTSNTSGYGNQLWEYNLSTDGWTRRADFPGGPRVDAFAFSVNGKGYVGAGLMANNQSISDLWQYDPSLDKWTQKTGIPQGDRAGALSFTYNNKGYVIFGTQGSGWMKRNDFWSYDPVADTWTQLQDFAGNARLQSALCIRNNKLFVIGGFDSNTVFKSDSWSYDFVSQQWSFIDYIDFQPQAYFFDNQKCYVLALSFNNFQENELNLFEYNPETNDITATRALFPGEFRWKPGVAIMKNNKIYVGLGAAGGNIRFLNDLWVYPTN